VAAELQDAFGVKAELVPGSRGIFDVVVDGKLVFSKYQEKRFPQPGELAGRLKP
jgi:selT/selW/selH-like putative selenoprotein